MTDSGSLGLCDSDDHAYDVMIMIAGYYGCIIGMDETISGGSGPLPLLLISYHSCSPTTYATTILPLTLPYPPPLPLPTPLPLLCSPFLPLRPHPSILLTCSPTLTPPFSSCLLPGNFSIHLTSLPSPFTTPLLFPGNFSIHLGKGGYRTPRLTLRLIAGSASASTFVSMLAAGLGPPVGLVSLVLVLAPPLLVTLRGILPRTMGLRACFLMRSAYANSRSSRVQGLQEGGTERVVGPWVQGGGGRGACFSPKACR